MLEGKRVKGGEGGKGEDIRAIRNESRWVEWGYLKYGKKTGQGTSGSGWVLCTPTGQGR